MSLASTEADLWEFVWWCDGSVCSWRPRRSDHKPTQFWRRCRHKVAFQTSSECVTTSNTLSTISALSARKTDTPPAWTVITLMLPIEIHASVNTEDVQSTEKFTQSTNDCVVSYHIVFMHSALAALLSSQRSYCDLIFKVCVNCAI